MSGGPGTQNGARLAFSWLKVGEQLCCSTAETERRMDIQRQSLRG